VIAGAGGLDGFRSPPRCLGLVGLAELLQVAGPVQPERFRRREPFDGLGPV
jgi:hypothetical protein